MTDSTVNVNVPDALRHIGAAVMLGLERAADRVAKELWLEGRHEYYVEDAIASEEGVNALFTYTEKMSDELVIAGVVGTKPQNLFIEHGRRPGPLPLDDPPSGESDAGEPYPQVIVDWMKAKGISPDSGDSSDFGYREAARNIGWALNKFGFEAREPLTHATERAAESGRIEAIVRDSLTRSLRARGLIRNGN